MLRNLYFSETAFGSFHAFFVFQFRLVEIVPGFRVGCTIMGALLSSSLQCLFEQSCLDTLYTLIHSTSMNPVNVTAMLYDSTQSQYSVTTKIEDIVNNLMIENWNPKISFNLYFKQCSPQRCTYTYSKQADLHYVIATIFGLVGGLSTLFRILAPALVNFWRRKTRPTIHLDERPGKFQANFLHAQITL